MGVKGKTVVKWGDEAGFCHTLPDFFRFIAGKKIAFDISCLLYRCGMLHMDEALATPPKFDNIVNSIRKKIQRVQMAKCSPVIVFDGAVPPGKEAENQRRHGVRTQILERVANGNAITSQEKQKLFDIHHPTLRVLLFDLMRELGVQYYVATNEADCELASLDRSGRVDAIVTRDGDLCILYAQIVIWEQTINWYGSGNEFKFASLPLFVEQVRQGIIKPKLDQEGLIQRLSACSSKEQVHLCLALMAGGTGCDYGSIPRAGWVKCCKALCAIPGDVTPEAFIERLAEAIPSLDKVEALKSLQITVDCYLHSFVYDWSKYPIEQMVTLSGLASSTSSMKGKSH